MTKTNYAYTRRFYFKDLNNSTIRVCEDINFERAFNKLTKGQRTRVISVESFADNIQGKLEV